MVADAGAFVVEDEAFGVAGTEGVPHDVAEGLSLIHISEPTRPY